MLKTLSKHTHAYLAISLIQGGWAAGRGEMLNRCKRMNIHGTGVSLTSMLLLKALLTFAVMLTTCPTLNNEDGRLRWWWGGGRWWMFRRGSHTSCYLIVCSKWMSSMEAVTQGDSACLSANNTELKGVTITCWRVSQNYNIWKCCEMISTQMKLYQRDKRWCRSI